MKKTIAVPLDVPKKAKKTYLENYQAITKGKDRLMLFAGDQKFEHLNPMPPEHLFEIGSSEHFGAFATQLGLLARYAEKYKDVNYIVKLNSKTNLIPPQTGKTLSRRLWKVEDVLEFKKNSGLKIRGVGYTIYPGSDDESKMFKEAAKIINEAHEHGLITILWSYPRTRDAKTRSFNHLMAGAAGVATCLSSDFVKIKPPETENDLKIAVESAGNTKVLCAGGKKVEPEVFLTTLYNQLQAGTSGVAVGRNIYKHEKDFAKKMIAASAALIYQSTPLDEALKIIKA